MNKRDMVIQSIVYLRGPNIWTYYSAIEAVIDIGDLEDCPSDVVPGLYERLVDWLPSLIEHRCSPGVRGGFLQRLRTGTWPCHILEHVTLALQDLDHVQAKAAVHQSRQHAHIGLAKQFLGELGRAVCGA